MERLKPVLLAVLVGCGCAFYLFKNVESNTLEETKYNAVAVQIGVFKDADTAHSMQEAYGGLVVEDDDLYRVYYSILNKDENIEFITNYLNDKGINYYLKDLRLSDKVIADSKDYEMMMTKTNEESKLAINEELLNIYKEVI